MDLYKKNLHGYGSYRQPIEANTLFQETANWLAWRKRAPRSVSPVSFDPRGEETPSGNSQVLILTSRRSPNPVAGA